MNLIIAAKMRHDRDNFVDLERHRQALEQNVAKLRTALQHWQAWEIEYEGMKEDILKFRDNPNELELVLQQCCPGSS